MAIDINMQLSHMIADDLGAAGIEAAIIDTLFVQKGGIKEIDLSAVPRHFDFPPYRKFAAN